MVTPNLNSLDKIADLLKASNWITISITGYTDAKRSDNYNMICQTSQMYRVLLKRQVPQHMLKWRVGYHAVCAGLYPDKVRMVRDRKVSIERVTNLITGVG